MKENAGAAVRIEEGAFARFLASEQIGNARRLNLVRFLSGMGFFILNALLQLGGLATSPSSFHSLLAGYVLISAGLFAAGRRSEMVARCSRHAVPFLDMPMVFLLQWISLSGAEIPRAVANFTLAIFIALIMLAALSLDRWQIILGAVVAAVLQSALYVHAGDSLYGVLSALVLIATSAAICAFARERRIEMVRGLCSEQLRLERLGRYFSPAVAAAIQRDREDLGVPQNAEVTVLFADLRDFTSLSEHLETREIVLLLNDYFEHMVQVIFSHGGTLDKYIGDGLMAYFGAPVPQADHARRAVTCALGMQQSLALLNATRRTGGLPAVRMGIGIHTGLAVVGSIGAFRRREYTAIGDTVNVASRIEQLCKKFDRDVLISAESAARAVGAASYTCLGEIPVKGRTAAVGVMQIELLP